MVEYENLGKSNARFMDQFETTFKRVISSGTFILGEELRAFESEFSSYHGVKFCKGVGSGTDALVLAFLALNLPQGSEVLVPANTYTGTVLSIVRANLRPVLVEPDARTYNIHPSEIEKKITSQTRALCVVHLYGQSCDMDPILGLCHKYDLRLVEDCAQAHGATYKGRPTGSFGDMAAFSFYPTKNLGALGDAGAILTSSEEYAWQIGALRNYGAALKNHHDFIGMNSRMDELHAALLRIKLKELDAIVSHKRNLASLYHQELGEHVIRPHELEGNKHSYHIFNIRHEKRDELRRYLEVQGIRTEIHYPIPPHRQKAFKDFFEGQDFPLTDLIHRTTLSLPISFFHTEEDVKKVASAINSFQ